MTNVKTMNKDTKYFLCFFDKEFFRTDVNKKIKQITFRKFCMKYNT